MVGQDSAGRLPLITFRCGARVDELVEGQMMNVIRLANHRPAYLDFEGPISGDRGFVTRVARGEVVAVHDVQVDRESPACELHIRWEGPSTKTAQRLRLVPARSPEGENPADPAAFSVSMCGCSLSQ